MSISDTSEVTIACNWFKNFYTTEFMIKCKYAEPLDRFYDEDILNGTKPMKFGEPYDEKQEKKDYDELLENYEKHPSANNYSNNRIAKYIYDSDSETDYERRGKPCKPLSPAAWSFSKGSLYTFEDMAQIYMFDYTTLTKIVVDKAVEIKETDKNPSKKDLIQAVKLILDTEASYAEMSNDYHKVGLLLSGIIYSDNWRWLSDADARKMALAHGMETFRDRKSNYIETICENQVKLIQEMVDKYNLQEDGRGYNIERSILKSSKEYLGIPLLPSDEPYREKRMQIKLQLRKDNNNTTKKHKIV